MLKLATLAQRAVCWCADLTLLQDTTRFRPFLFIFCVVCVLFFFFLFFFFVAEERGRGGQKGVNYHMFM